VVFLSSVDLQVNRRVWGPRWPELLQGGSAEPPPAHCGPVTPLLATWPGDFAKLSAEEYSRLLNALRAQPNARQRPQLGLGRSTDGL